MEYQDDLKASLKNILYVVAGRAGMMSASSKSPCRDRRAVRAARANHREVVQGLRAIIGCYYGMG
jgi:hypothetical protein